MNYEESFEKQQKSSEEIFSELFGLFDKKEERNPLFFEKDGVYYFANGKSSAQAISWPGNTRYLEIFDWKNSKLKFVMDPETEFHAKLMNFDLEKQIILFFDGEWISGGFYGEKFVGVFSGDYFKGRFVGRNLDYKSHPTTFIDGTIYNPSEGILGLPNTLTTTNGQFEFVSVPVGHSIQFRTKNGINNSIKVLKRIDGNNSQFQYEVYNGFTKQKSMQTIEWPTIRNGWNTGVYQIYMGSKNIANLIEIPQGDAIIEMYISKSQADFKSGAPEEFDSKKKYQFDLKSIPGLDIKQLRGEKGRLIGNANTLVNLNFASEEEFREYEKILQSIKSGQFAQDLKNINRAIRYGEVDGYGPYIYLKKIFNNIQGKNATKLAEAKGRGIGQMQPNIGAGSMRKATSLGGGSAAGQQSKKQAQHHKQQGAEMGGIAGSMLRINNFVKFFIDNITTKLGKPHSGAKKFVFDRLKLVLGTDTLIQAKTTPEGPIEPGQQSTPDFANQFTMRESVRGIISKHF